MLDSMEAKYIPASGSGAIQGVQKVPTEYTPTSALLQPVSFYIIIFLKYCVHTLQLQIPMPSNLLQTDPSDDIYDQGESDLTSFEALMLDSMENIHQQVSSLHVWYRLDAHARHFQADYRFSWWSPHGQTLSCFHVTILIQLYRLPPSHLLAAPHRCDLHLLHYFLAVLALSWKELIEWTTVFSAVLPEAHIWIGLCVP
jgi:hypothetical protein